MKRIVFITGASKGLGAAIAEEYKSDNCYLFSRSKIETQAKSYQIDFSNLTQLEPLFTQLFKDVSSQSFKEILFIHNAAMIDPIGFSGTQSSGLLIKSITTGYSAVLLLTNLFIHQFQHLPAKKRVLLVSSGAAINPYEGWSHYCSVKAGINMFAECVFKEQRHQKYPIEISTFRPGVIDTDMQDIIRKQTKENFPNIEKFKQLKIEGVLRKPENVARAIAILLLRDRWSKPHADITEILPN